MAVKQGGIYIGETIIHSAIAEGGVRFRVLRPLRGHRPLNTFDN